MEARRTRVSGTIRTEGGSLPADLLGRISAGDTSVPGLVEADLAGNQTSAQGSA